MKFSFENNYNNKKNFSLPLELIKEKKEKSAELENRIVEREKLIEYLEKEAELLEEKGKDAVLINQKIAAIKKETEELKNRKKETEKEIFGLFYKHKEMTQELENFESDIEQ